MPSADIPLQDGTGESPSGASSTESLNPEQKQAATYRGGPLLVLAGAGTGKTRVIVHRIASLIEEGVSPGRILAVTFTNKATDEMRRRIDALVPGGGAGLWVHTFHAFSARLLRRHAKEAKITPHFTVFDQDDQKRIVTQVLRDLGLEKEKNKASLYVSVISRAKDDLLDPRSYSIHAMTQQDPFRETVAKVYEGYQAKLDAAGGLDFGDLLLRATVLLKESEEVRSYYQSLFEHILIDEYQDTNHAQYVITRTLSAKHRNLCVVGDPDQSIYKFRGAHIRNILEFESDFKDSKIVKLEQNYRSTPNILGAASAVIRNNRQRQAKSLWTKNTEGAAVESRELGDEREEARWVTSRIIRMLDEGASLKEIAVFYRTNAQSRQFEDALRIAQLPYRVVGSVRFYERKEVKDVLAYARAAINESDSVSLSRVLNVPARGIGKAAQRALFTYGRSRGFSLRETLARCDEAPGLSAHARSGARALSRLLDVLSEDVRTLLPSEAMQAVFRRTGYWDWLEGLSETDHEAVGRMGNLQELLNAVKEFEEHGAGGEERPRLERFLEDAALQSGADSYDEGSQAVTLMTVHLAKGLEFPSVFVTGLEEGLFPISAGNSSPDELEEERRLCYVAMTRAKRKLILTHAARRRLFGRSYTNLPSRFVLEARIVRGPEGRERPAAAAPSSESRAPVLLRIRRGMRVRHPEFGRGKIVEKSGSGESLKVTVVFENGKTKKLLVRYAPLMPA